MSNILIKRLTDEMKQQNLTGRKLSMKANLSYNAIHYIVSGKNKSTNFEVVNAIADALGVSPFYLLDEKYDKNQKYLQEPKEIEKFEKEASGTEIPYDGELYREIMSVVEKLLVAKNNLTTQKIEYFTHYIYSQIQKDDSKKNEKDIKSYAEGIIDYALNIEDS